MATPQSSSAPAVPSLRLDGRTALVTGSSRGLGLAMARRLGLQGARVALNWRNGKEKAEQAYEELKGRGIQCDLFCGNVIDEADVNDLCARVAKSLGPIDLLVVNATPDQPHMPIEEYDWAFHQSMLDFFVKSPFLLARALLPRMKQQRFGRIVNLGSEVVRLGVPNFSAYVAAKGAQMGWTRSMARELAPWQITVNMVSPGWIPVERHANDPQSDKDSYRATIPLDRWGVPDDVGGLVAFLCSDAAAQVRGVAWTMDGGWVAQ